MGARKKSAVRVGDVIGDIYELRRPLGRGGMGEVFEAYDQSLNRLVAVKVPYSVDDGDNLIAEAKAMAAFRDPGLVVVYEIGDHEGVPFIAMERLHGPTLREHLDVLRRGDARMSTREVIDLVRRVAEILQPVHNASLAHCDLKPSNVILGPRGRVVLLDFGVFQIERLLGDQTAFFGSPYYIAPEIAKHDVHSGQGHLVDMYALGVIAYELLCGLPPFRAKSAKEIFRMHVRDPVPPIELSRADVPQPLIELVHQLLSKQPDARPPVEVVVETLRSKWAIESSRPHAGYSVLVVDDESVMCELLATALRTVAADVDIRTAANGVEALSACQERAPDVVLTDIQMPEMSGMELCMHLSGTRLAEGTTIIAMSACTDEADERLLRQLGVADVVVKDPSRSGAFMQTVRASVSRALRARTRPTG